jgi:hypothetical protein
VPGGSQPVAQPPATPASSPAHLVLSRVSLSPKHMLIKGKKCGTNKKRKRAKRKKAKGCAFSYTLSGAATVTFTVEGKTKPRKARKTAGKHGTLPATCPTSCASPSGSSSPRRALPSAKHSISAPGAHFARNRAAGPPACIDSASL